MTDENNNPADEPVEKAEVPTEEGTELTPDSPPESVADVVVESTVADTVVTPVPEPDPEPEPHHEVEPVAELPTEPETVEADAEVSHEAETEPEPEPEPSEVDAESLDAITAVVVGGAEAATETIDTPAADVPPIEAAVEAPVAPPEEERKRWYVVKVQSGREESIKAAIERRMRIEALEHLVGQIVIPTEKISVRKKVTERKKVGNEYQKVSKEKIVYKYQKKFPGYLMAFVEYNDEILSLFRGTSGVGDFVGGTLTRAPTPMTASEVEAMLRGGPGDEPEDPTIAPPVLKFGKGDRVKVRDGIFAGLDGEVKEVVEAKDSKETTRVKIELMIFGRPTSVDLEHWQVDPV